MAALRPAWAMWSAAQHGPLTHFLLSMGIISHLQR